MPERIQLSRTKGWRKPEGAIVVARPSRWGNPWRVTRDEDGQWFVSEEDIEADYADDQKSGCAHAANLFRAMLTDGIKDPPAHPSTAEIRAELRGHDLACWCPLDQPCHADVLLEIANQEGT